MTITVSVIIPYYNASATLARALESVKRQTAPAHEIIIVDDASTQQERHKAERIVSRYDRVSMISLEHNAGPAGARNIGWESAQGEWIAFLDSDDAWHPRKLELLTAASRAAVPSPDLVASRTVYASSFDDFSSVIIPPNLAIRRLAKRHMLVRNWLSTPAVMLRRDLPERFGIGRRFSEDYELWLTLVGNSRTLLFIDAPLAAIFKAPYGASGLSAQIMPMIWGEFNAYVGARNSGALTTFEMLAGLIGSALRSLLRLTRLALRRLGSQR